jgi:predicted dehydrogenase
MFQFGRHADLYEVVACADVVAASAEKLAADYGLRAMESVSALVADPEIELIVAATKPPVTHRDIAVAAAAAGKHVVVEKPMATSDAECAEMVAASAAAGKILAVHHNRRWDVDFLNARHVVESGVLGEMRFVRNEYTAGFEGSPYDWGIHIIDQTMALSRGKKFVELSATFSAPTCADPLESEGYFTCRLRTEDGVAHDCGMLPPANGNVFLPGAMTPRFALFGTEGVVYQTWCQRPQDAFGKTLSFQSTTGKALGDPSFLRTELSVPDFYDRLHTAIREGGPVPVTGEDGRRAVRAWELICQSACEGRTLEVSL